MGSELFERAMDAHFEIDSDLMILIADNDEADFCVSDWYSRNGFEDILVLGSGLHYMMFSQHDDLIDNYRDNILNKVTP